MEKLLSIIEAQRELLNFIGYDIDIKKSEIPLFESIDIKKGNTKVGTFDIKKSNLKEYHSIEDITVTYKNGILEIEK